MTRPLATTVRHRRGRPGGPSGVVGVFRTIAVSAAVLAVSATSVSAIGAWRLSSQLATNEVDINNGRTVAAIGPISGAFNVLLVGADNSAGQKGYGETRDATLNDVNIVVHVAANHRSGVVLSLPRDLVIDQPACVDPKTKQQYPAVVAQPLNASIARGGLGCVVATVQQQTGLQIPYAAQFSFQGTVAMADAVGGVEVCATKAINDPSSGLTLPAGRSTIAGRTALAYLRDRHGIGDGSDLGRIASQQAYMSSLLRKMTSSSTLTSPTRLYSLADAAARNVSLSTSLASVDQMVQMMLAVKQVNLAHMVFVQYPSQTDPYNVNKVVPDQVLATTLMKRITAGKPIKLGAANLGNSAVLDKSAKAKARIATTKQHPDALARLRGQTANERTCSVAAH